MRSSTSPLLACLALLTVPACVADDATGPDGGDPPDPVTAALDLPSTPFDYDDELPAHFQTAAVRARDNTPTDNPITSDGATLGRVLFYDVTLSASDTVACATCHQQDHAFTDARRFSEGFDGDQTDRNSMSTIDARFYLDGRFFWDERAATLEDQVLMPIQSSVEMGLTLDELVTKVAAQPYYPYLFERAFGDAEVTSDRIARALAQFVRAQVSYRSPYDQALAQVGDVGRPFPSFTVEEERGKQLFLGAGGCGGCHLDPGPAAGPGPRPNQAIFMLDFATNNGLDGTTNVADNGVGDITGDPVDDGRFKSPSLRNVALTGPYMHDGRLETLDDVIDFYDLEVQPHPNLDPRLRVPPTGPGTPPGGPRQLGLSVV